MEKLRFSSISELNKIAMNLDRAEERVAGSYNPHTNKWVNSSRYKAIYNIDTNSEACLASTGYKLVQHRELLESFTDMLAGFRLGIFGTVWNYNNRFEVELSFKNKITADTVHIGIRFVNSYNKSSGITGEVFGFRTACENGMFLGKVLGEIRLDAIHYGKLDIIATMREFVKRAINSDDKLKALISDAMTDSIEWSLATKLMEKLSYANKHREAILAILKKDNGKKKITRWDLYNAITSYCSHGEKVSHLVESWHQKKAQQLLTSNKPQLIALLEQQVQK